MKKIQCTMDLPDTSMHLVRQFIIISAKFYFICINNVIYSHIKYLIHKQSLLFVMLWVKFMKK